MREGGCPQPPRIATGGSSPRSTENGVGATDARDSPAPQASGCLSEANPQGRKGPSASLPLHIRGGRNKLRPPPQASGCLSEANPQGRKGPSATLPYIHDGEGAVATTPARGHKTTIYQLPSTNYHLPSTNFSIFRIVTAPAGRRPTRSRRRSRPPRPSASVLPHRPAPSGRTPRADASAAVPFLGLQL